MTDHTVGKINFNNNPGNNLDAYDIGKQRDKKIESELKEMRNETLKKMTALVALIPKDKI